MAATDYITLTTVLAAAGVQVTDILDQIEDYDFAGNPTSDASKALTASQNFANGEIHRHLRARTTAAVVLADDDAMRSLNVHGLSILVWHLTQNRQVKLSEADVDAYEAAMKFLRDVQNGKSHLVEPGMNNLVSSQHNPRSFQFDGNNSIANTMDNFSPEATRSG